MIEKFFQRWSVQIILHIFILVCVFVNGFYLIETWKIYKNNQKLQNYAQTTNQNITNLRNQNSYELLELYKDKIIKKSSYKKTDEQVFDISNLEQQINQKITSEQSKQEPNFNKWLECLVSKNKVKVYSPDSFCR